MKIHFHKYQGTGNDFVIIDNRNATLSLTTAQVKWLCDRRFGIGADGLMLLEKDPIADFKMLYFNADGRESTMCGNGGRCMVHFAHQIEAIGKTTTFNAIDGLHEAVVTGDFVRLKMIDVAPPEQHEAGWFLNTGSPHVVCEVADTEAVDVQKTGAEIRYSDAYGEGGVNVNFVSIVNDKHLNVRTYERGVEAETFSCGTGVTAVALAHATKQNLSSERIEMTTPGGSLAVSFQRNASGGFQEVFLEGPATFVFKGVIELL
ncbi:MAG: diaminopimelate epimerase [Schleiferiaceae bacterium]|nr:diaminopimelate epimerase [Schleiferiaceae bacterium]